MKGKDIKVTFKGQELKDIDETIINEYNPDEGRRKAVEAIPKL